MCNLADCYIVGADVDKSIEKDVEWYDKGTQHDLVSAHSELGVCYYEGNVVEKNPMKAVKLFKPAGRTKETEALRNLVYALLDALDVQEDHKKAFKFLSDATHDSANANACYEPGRCFEIGPGTMSSASKAKELYVVAAKARKLTASSALVNLLQYYGRFREACQYHLKFQMDMTR